jgi:hypothetical protein
VAQDLADLGSLADSLSRAVAALGNGVEAERAQAEILRLAAQLVESAQSGSLDSNQLAASHTDLEVFLVAEDLRDQVGAAGLAGALFRFLAGRFSGSPIAPKALIAAAQIDPARADSLLLLVHVRYATSPYALQLRGAAGDRYAAIEDSLRSLIAAKREPTPREH